MKKLKKYALQARAPLTEEHKAKLRAGILSSSACNTWRPEEIALARTLYERAARTVDIAKALNAIYNRRRTPQAVCTQMRRIGARFGAALQPDEVAGDPDIRQRMLLSERGRLGAEVRESYADKRSTTVYHPLYSNPRLLALLAR